MTTALDRLRRRIGAIAAVAAVALGVPVLAACGGSGSSSGSSESGSTGSTTLTIYSSLPLQGPSRAQSVSIVNAQKLALKEVGGRIGPFTIKFASLDDSTAEAGRWDPGQTSANARRAAQDRTTIAYLGESSSGASAISIPIMNAVGVLQVSPLATAVGLTRGEGAVKGEPDKYYPSAKRNFGRVLPADDAQAEAQVAYQRATGCSRVFLLDDRELFGKSLAAAYEPLAREAGLTLVGSESIDRDAASYRSLAAEIREEGADCVFFAGGVESNAVRLFRDLHAGHPRARLFGPHALVTSTFARALGEGAARVTHLTSPALAPRLYPAAGRRFFRDYKRTYGHDPEPAAIFGYEAMSVALQAIRDAAERGNDRQAVIDAFFRIKDRRSVLGRYSIEGTGDTTLRTYAAWRVRDGRLRFDHVIAQRDS
jgi:branched-chain amino acid transport system substrate-binding protein